MKIWPSVAVNLFVSKGCDNHHGCSFFTSTLFLTPLPLGLPFLVIKETHSSPYYLYWPSQPLPWLNHHKWWENQPHCLSAYLRELECLNYFFLKALPWSISSCILPMTGFKTMVITWLSLSKTSKLWSNDSMGIDRCPWPSSLVPYCSLMDTFSLAQNRFSSCATVPHLAPQPRLPTLLYPIIFQDFIRFWQAKLKLGLFNSNQS